MQLEKIQIASPKLPELVMQALISAIDNGQIRVGEELPSERDLAETLGRRILGNSAGSMRWRSWGWPASGPRKKT